MYLPGTINERIGDLRISKGLSRKELSDIIGIASSQLSRIEKGQTQHISSDILIKLSKSFDVSTDYIYEIISKLQERESEGKYPIGGF